MNCLELTHWPYRIYHDNEGVLYVHDEEEGLVFVRGNVSNNKYDLAVIVEEGNGEYGKWADILSPVEPCGFQLFDELNLNEWNNLVREYLRNKHSGKQFFRKWIKRKLYAPIGKMLYEQSLIYESMPCPDASEKENQDL